MFKINYKHWELWILFSIDKIKINSIKISYRISIYRITSLYTKLFLFSNGLKVARKTLKSEKITPTYIHRLQNKS